MKYQPGVVAVLTWVHYLDRGPCMVGSLTGAVSSQIVTEEYEGLLGTVGHRTDSAMAKGGLTARPTRRAGAKAGHRDRKSTRLNSSHPSRSRNDGHTVSS